MLASLLAAGTWLLIASMKGWPVSTTHSIVGAIVGFALAGLGIGRGNLPLDFLGLPGCKSLVRNILIDLPFAADSAGRARFMSRLDNNPSWIGGSFTYQWWFLDRTANPFGFAGSDGAEFRIGAGL